MLLLWIGLGMTIVITAALALFFGIATTLSRDYSKWEKRIIFGMISYCVIALSLVTVGLVMVNL